MKTFDFIETLKDEIKLKIIISIINCIKNNDRNFSLFMPFYYKKENLNTIMEMLESIPVNHPERKNKLKYFKICLFNKILPTIYAMSNLIETDSFDEIDYLLNNNALDIKRYGGKISKYLPTNKIIFLMKRKYPLDPISIFDMDRDKLIIYFYAYYYYDNEQENHKNFIKRYYWYYTPLLYTIIIKEDIDVFNSVFTWEKDIYEDFSKKNFSISFWNTLFKFVIYKIQKKILP